jgi:potassium-transporting ATPase potassium-binding subunit
MVFQSQRNLKYGIFPTHNLLFVVLLLGTVLVIGGLTFVPALALGPITEALQVPALSPPIQR